MRHSTSWARLSGDAIAALLRAINLWRLLLVQFSATSFPNHRPRFSATNASSFKMRIARVNPRDYSRWPLFKSMAGF
jgi:hypothetical protein